MWLSNITIIQTAVWVVAGSAVLRLWNAYDWIVWTLLPLLLLEMAIAATLKRVVHEGDSDMIKTAEELNAFRRVWVRIHMGVCAAAVALGIYGHTLA